MERRYFSRGLMGALVSGILFPGCKAKETTVEDSIIVERARRYAEKHFLPQHRASFIETAQEVESYYSTALVRERHGARLFEWPANYMAFNAKKRFEKYAIAGKDGFEFPPNSSLGQWKFFWPDLNGFDQENWMDFGDPRMIDYLIYRIHPPGSAVTTTEQSMGRLHASKAIESRPSLQRHGLEGYRWVLADGTPREVVEWLGKRDDGRLFRMRSIDPEKASQAPVPHPQCDVSMFDADTGEEVVYRYSLSLFEHWRSIEEGTRKKIRSWQIS